jgi:N-acetyl sugar amidotransferase
VKNKKWPLQTNMQECSRCLYAENNVPSITFREDGVCNYCDAIEDLEKQYPTGVEGKRRLEDCISEIKEAGKGKQYDVIVGVSGGCDSSYMIHLCGQYGLRALGVHFDNTWNSSIAVENIQCMLRAYDFDLWTYVVDHDEFDDVFKAMLLSGTPDSDVVTDLAFATVLRMACEKFDVNYIFEGHSFRTEGLAPQGWIYMDARYISDVHKRFGKLPMKTYPSLWLRDFVRWTTELDMKFVRPLYWLDYDKEEAKALLSEEYGWQWYGGHHLENMITSWVHQYFWPRRWGIDGRLLGHCAMIRSGSMLKSEADALLEKPQQCAPDHLAYVLKRLNWTDRELSEVMSAPTRSAREYRTYRRAFCLLKPLFLRLAEKGKIPLSFVMRYCNPYPIEKFRGHTQQLARWGYDASHLK